MSGVNKSILVILGVGAVIALIAFIQYSSLDASVVATSGPSIEVFPKSYNFGDVPYREVKTILQVKNNGELPLKITGVSTSCGCTRAYIEKTNIPPGDSANLTVTFDPNLMGMELYGRIFRVVYIQSNDPHNPEVEVEISANVTKQDSNGAAGRMERI